MGSHWLDKAIRIIPLGFIHHFHIFPFIVCSPGLQSFPYSPSKSHFSMPLIHLLSAKQSWCADMIQNVLTLTLGLFFLSPCFDYFHSDVYCERKTKLLRTHHLNQTEKNQTGSCFYNPLSPPPASVWDKHCHFCLFEPVFGQQATILLFHLNNISKTSVSDTQLIKNK